MLVIDVRKLGYMADRVLRAFTDEKRKTPSAPFMVETRSHHERQVTRRGVVGQPICKNWKRRGDEDAEFFITFSALSASPRFKTWSTEIAEHG